MPLKDKDDGAWYMDIVKTLAKKAGEEVARKILDEFGGPVGQILKDLIFGKPPEDLSKYLKEIDQKLSDVSRLVKEHYQFDLFALYNQADDGLAVLISAYKHSSEGSDSRKNACLKVLDKDGVFAKARTMAAAMLSPKQPTNKSVLQLYADFLIDSNLDVYAYRDSLFALASHLRLNLVQAAALREVCRREINDSSKEHDVVITEQEITDSIDVPSTEVLRPSTDLQKLFEEISTNEFEIRVIHCNTGKLLTGYLPGTQFTTHEPFDKY